MRAPKLVGVKHQMIAWAAATVVAVGLSGCSSDGSTDDSAASTSSAAPTSTSAVPPPTTAPPAPGPSLTLTDYLASIGVTAEPARPAEGGAPTIELPTPTGWETAIDVPGDSFWAVMLTQAADPANPPILQASLMKLSKEVPIQDIFDHAAGEMSNLPGYQPLGDGGRGSLGGLEAYQVGGMYVKNGVQTLVAQKTSLITSPSGSYVLEVRAEGPQDDAQALVSATADLDKGTVIRP